MLLEPIMKLEIVTPEDYLGNITADLSSRRALIDQHQHPRQADGHRRPGPAGEDVRLLDRRPQPEPGPGRLHHGAARIRRGARQPARLALVIDQSAGM